VTNDELKVLVIEAGAIFDQIDDLPLNDDGTRELPPGMLDRAREIAAIAFSLRSPT
jgi:hypothetical protein